MPDPDGNTLGEHIDGGASGGGRTYDEAVADAFNNGRNDLGFGPGWFEVKAVYVRVENPIREYKAVIVPAPGGGG